MNSRALFLVPSPPLPAGALSRAARSQQLGASLMRLRERLAAEAEANRGSRRLGA